MPSYIARMFQPSLTQNAKAQVQAVTVSVLSHLPTACVQEGIADIKAH